MLPSLHNPTQIGEWIYKRGLSTSNHASLHPEKSGWLTPKQLGDNCMQQRSQQRSLAKVGGWEGWLDVDVLLPMSQDRSNIPSMQHCIWLTMVTMTSVGYGDYCPTSLEGYLTVSVLTFVSVLFLALPVGIIGYEFTHSWQNRAKVLLINKTRKCLEKWGYSASDVKVLFDYVDVDGDGNLNLSASWFWVLFLACWYCPNKHALQQTQWDNREPINHIDPESCERS